MDTVIRGLSAAAKHAGCAVRTLREAIAAGTVPATKTADGVWEIRVTDLDTLRAQHAQVAPTVPEPVAAAIAYPTEPEPEPAARQTPQIVPWLAPVPEPRVYSAPAFERAEPAPAHEPLGSSGEQPFWVAQGVTSSRETDSVRGQLEAARTEVAQLTQQLAQVTAQLRNAQIGSIACSIAIESLYGAAHAGLIPPEVVQVTYQLRDAAAQALASLSPDQLASPQHAYAIARQAVHVASQQIAVQIDRHGHVRRDDRRDREREQRERAAREEADREHERQLAARAAAITQRFRDQQLAMARRHDEELRVMREAISTVAAKREREVDSDREHEREERARAREDQERAAQAAYQQRVQELQQQQADQITALRTEIAAVAARRRGRN